MPQARAPRARRRSCSRTSRSTEKRDDRTRTLSGGMKRRLILARALMHRPRLLILDEPTAGVDVELRLELWHYVQRINAEGTTILLTTHYLEEAEQLCNRIAFINDGEIVATGHEPRPGASSYGVRSLEDAYLALVGRKELSRAHVGGGRAVTHRRRSASSRCVRREVNRFMKIKRQTVGAPLLETFLYISRLRRRARLAHRHAARLRLRRLRHPRADHDGLGDERVLQQRVVDPAAEVPARRSTTSSPRPPRRCELLLAFTFGGFLRGMIVATLTFVAADILVGIPVEHLLVLLPGVFLVGLLLRPARRARRRARRAVRRRRPSTRRSSCSR